MCAHSGDKERKHYLAVFYDELVRKDWARRARGGEVIDFNLECCELSKGMLRRAERQFDEYVKAFQKQPVKRPFSSAPLSSLPPAPPAPAWSKRPQNQWGNKRQRG